MIPERFGVRLHGYATTDSGTFKAILHE